MSTIYTRKPAPVQVEVIEDGDLQGGVRVTEDGTTRVLTLDEFETRFEEKEVNSFPGKIALADEQGMQPGLLACTVTGDTPDELAQALNAWAENPKNTGLVMWRPETYQWQDDLAMSRYSCLFLVSSHITDEHKHHLSRFQAKVNELLAEEDAKNLAIQQTALARARELTAMKQEADRQKLKELEELAAMGRHHKNNCKKAGKK